MKALNIILTIVFLLFAVVQFNDPDPWLWATYYLLVALAPGMAIFKKYAVPLLLSGMLISIVWAGTILPEFIGWVKMGMPTIVGHMKAEEPYIEFTREFLGLFLGLVVFIFYYFRARKTNELKS